MNQLQKSLSVALILALTTCSSLCAGVHRRINQRRKARGRTITVKAKKVHQRIGHGKPRAHRAVRRTASTLRRTNRRTARGAHRTVRKVRKNNRRQGRP